MVITTLTEITKTGVTSEKIKLWESLPKALKTLLTLTINKKYNFYMSGRSEFVEWADLPFPEEFPQTKAETEKEYFYTLVKHLRAIKKTKTQKIPIDKFVQWVNTLPTPYKIWASRIAIKSPRLGISSKALLPNKWEVMLAKDYYEMPLSTKEKFLNQPLWTSDKLDGYRVTFYNDTLKSRDGVNYENYDLVLKAITNIKNFIKTLPYPWNAGVVLDGEIYSKTFKEMQETAFRKDGKAHSYKFAIFDAVPKKEWDSNNFTLSFTDRYAVLQQIVGAINNPVIEAHPQTLHLNPTDQILNESLTEALSRGVEGLMVKTDGPYFKGKKSHEKAMFKLKQFKFYDVEIIGFIEGKGRLKNTLGKVQVRGPEGVITEVGSGFTDSERKEIWENRETYQGSIIEIRAFEITEKNRFKNPSFKCIRHDKTQPDY